MISIIIPIKTTENEYWNFLHEAIKSVLRQTNKNYELIISPYENDVSEGRNKGIEKAKREWILCLDADDTLDPTFIEKVLPFGEFFDIIATDGIINNTRFTSSTGNLDYFLQWNRILSCSVFKKEVWEKYHFNEELGGYEDWDFWINALRNGFTIGTVNQPLVTISDRPNSRNKEAITRHNELKSKIIW